MGVFRVAWFYVFGVGREDLARGAVDRGAVEFEGGGMGGEVRGGGEEMAAAGGGEAHAKPDDRFE